MKKLLLIFALFIAFLFPLKTFATIGFDEDFESYDVSDCWDNSPSPGDSWKANGSTCSQTYRYNTVVSTPAQDTRSVKIWSSCASGSTTSSRRIELIFQDQASSGAYPISNATEYWIRIDKYIDSTYPDTGSTSGMDQAIFQIKSVEEGAPTCDPEEPALNPIFSLNLNEDYYKVHIRADDRACTVDKNYDRSNTYTPNNDNWHDDEDTWVEWIFHFKTDYDGGSNYMVIYKNGEEWWSDPLAGQSGANNGFGFNDSSPFFVQTGIYDYVCASTDDRYIQYMDNAKIGDSSESLSTMSDFSSTPSVSINATDASGAEESQDTVTFTISCSPVCAGETINYSFSGDAVLNTDYDCDDEDGTIDITGASDTIVCTPVDDSDPEITETITITIDSGTGYFVGDPASDSASITDNDGAQDQGIAGITVDASGSGSITYNSSGSGSWNR